MKAKEISLNEYNYINQCANNKYKEYIKYNDVIDPFNLIEPLINFDVFKAFGYDKLNLIVIN